MSKIISHPIAKYNMRDINGYFPVKKSFFKIPTNVKVNIVIKILVPE